MLFALKALQPGINKGTWLPHEDEIIIDGMCIVPDPLEEPPEPTPVPDWIRNNAKWWAEGQITEDDFVTGIEFLVKQGIIKVN